jgi:hypothetical protein
MSELHSHLGTARDWYFAHMSGVEPLRLQGREDEAFATIEQCRRQLEGSPLSADERTAIRYELLMDDYLVINYIRPEELQADAIRECFGKISALPPVGPLSDRTQAFQQLSLVGMGTRRRALNPGEADVDALLERVPEECRTNVLWYYISSWAFLNRRIKYLELAYVEQLTRPSGVSDAFYWLRTNLMYLLLSGRATRRDVLETIRSYDREIDMVDFDNFFRRPLQEIGMYDREVEEAIEKRRRELQEALSETPKQEARTKQLSR